MDSGAHILSAISVYLNQTCLHTKFKNPFGLSALATPQTPGFNVVLQSSRNKLMHIINGNTTSTLLLDYLVPPPLPIQISKDTLLQHRIPAPPGLLPQPLLPITTLTTPPVFDTSQEVRFQNKRTGRRRRRVDENGVSHLASIGNRELEFIRIYRIRALPLMLRSPPPKDTPGALQGRTKRDPALGEVSMAPCRGPANGETGAGLIIAAGAGKPNNTCQRGRTPF